MTSLLRTLFVLCFTSAVAAHEIQAPPDWQPVPFANAAAHAPRPLPDRIVLTWDGDPATTQAVTWRTDTSVLRAVAELAVAGDNGYAMQTTAHPARTELLEADLGPAHYHSVTFTDLQPETLYAYRVGDGVNWSEFFHFRTASREPKPFSFLYFGDAQNGIKTHWSRVFREGFREAPRAAFVVHAGDLVDRGHSDAQWGEWFGGPAWVNATVPVVPTPGNHEYWVLREDGRQRNALSIHWRPQFTLPQNGPPGMEEVCYYFDYQGTRIISLDSQREPEPQAIWLRQVLAQNPQRWTVVTFHHPIFAPRTPDNAVRRKLWKDVFDEFKVDLVLTGHDHTYARTGDVGGRPMETNLPEGYQQAYDPAIGTVYVVSVSGPKLFGGATRDFARRAGKGMQLFQVITIDGDELRFSALTATGALYDEFILKKRPGQPNELRELLPPEDRSLIPPDEIDAADDLAGLRSAPGDR
jgi:3',5'-cyclic AMP phosphodiesterase CpdA